MVEGKDKSPVDAGPFCSVPVGLCSECFPPAAAVLDIWLQKDTMTVRGTNAEREETNSLLGNVLGAAANGKKRKEKEFLNKSKCDASAPRLLWGPGDWYSHLRPSSSSSSASSYSFSFFCGEGGPDDLSLLCRNVLRSSCTGRIIDCFDGITKYFLPHTTVAYLSKRESFCCKREAAQLVTFTQFKTTHTRMLLKA